MHVKELLGKYVYLAGPYSVGGEAKNVRNMVAIADRLMDHGVIVFNPLLSHFHQLITARFTNYWYSYDLKWLEKCDVLIYLPGESKGVAMEIAHALKLGIPVHAIETISFRKGVRR